MHLIIGNNDPPAVLTLNWITVQSYAEIKVDGIPLVLCHYPFRTWNGMGNGAVNLHGHSHGRLKPMKRQFDVGVDARQFRPVTLAGLISV
jgi:calcineurin-like phosphoesterase family protein